MRKVFISHTARDAEWARSFARTLKERGVSVRFDEFDVQPGDSLRDALESGLRNSDIFVALLDVDAPAEPNLFFEPGAAIGMRKKVVPMVPKGLISEHSRWICVFVAIWFAIRRNTQRKSCLPVCWLRKTGFHV